VSTDLKQSDERALLLANRIARAAPDEWPGIFEGLRRGRQLSATMRRLNRLLDKPAHRELLVAPLGRTREHRIPSPAAT
jgi:hypothetical protein